MDWKKQLELFYDPIDLSVKSVYDEWVTFGKVDNKACKVPEPIIELAKMTKLILIPSEITCKVIFGFNKGWYILLLVSDLFNNYSFYVKKFDFFSEFGSLKERTVTTHSSESTTGQKQYRPRIDFTGNELTNDLGLDLKDKYQLGIKSQYGYFPGYLIIFKKM